MKKKPYIGDEQRIIDYLTEAHNLFVRLEQTHPSHLTEWANGIHQCQDVLIHRIVQRDYPDEFGTIK